MKLKELISGKGGKKVAGMPMPPAGWVFGALKPPSLGEVLGGFRVELAAVGRFDEYLARLMVESSEKRAVGDKKLAILPRYEDIGWNDAIGVLREYLQSLVVAEFERYLANAYIRLRDVCNEQLIAAEGDITGTFNIPADSPLNAELAAKCAGDTDKAGADGDDSGKDRDGYCK